MTENKTGKWLILIALLMAAVMLFSACGHSAGSDGSEPGAPEEPAAEEEQEESAGPAVVTAVWADDAEIGDHLDFEADTDSETKVAFFTDARVTDFTLLSVFLEGVSDDGTAEFSCETVYLQEALEPDLPLVVNMTFYGDIPNYGIGYTDTDGTARRFTVSISGEDGSLVLSEF